MTSVEKEIISTLVKNQTLFYELELILVLDVLLDGIHNLIDLVDHPRGHSSHIEQLEVAPEDNWSSFNNFGPWLLFFDVLNGIIRRFIPELLRSFALFLFFHSPHSYFICIELSDFFLIFLIFDTDLGWFLFHWYACLQLPITVVLVVVGLFYIVLFIHYVVYYLFY